MTRMTGPDCAVICNLINTHTHTHIDPPLGASMRVAPNDKDDRADCAVICNLINTLTHTHDGMELSHPQSGAPPGTRSIPS